MIDWKPIHTFKYKPGKLYIFWQPECKNGRSTLPARVVSWGEGTGARKTTYWAEVNDPEIMCWKHGESEIPCATCDCGRVKRTSPNS